MPTLDPIASHSVSGHVKLRQGKRRSTWYAKWRDAQGVQRERKLGLVWEGKGAPPPGYLRQSIEISSGGLIPGHFRVGA